MKRIQYICIALTALTVLFACSPVQLEETYGSSGQAIVLTALSAQNAPDTKTELKDNGADVFWSAADVIQVFQGSEGARFVSTNAAPALQAEFRGYLPVSTAASLDLWAVYPYDETNTSDGNGITATVPADQQAIAGTFDPSALLTVAHTDNLTLAFQNVCGGLKFKVAGDWIQQVEFRSNDGSPLAGKVSVSIDESGHPVVTGIEEPSDAVRLTAPYGETLQPETWYYLCCLPVYLENGFTLVFRSETQTAVKDYSGEKEVERSTWGRLSAADADVVPEEETNNLFDNLIYYTTTDGEVFEPNNGWGFGANIISNTYENGKGKILFDGPVTRIPYCSFWKWSGGERLSGIWLPLSVATIDGSAFAGCESLGEVGMPAGLRTIESSAFSGCSGLTEVSLPDGLLSIGESAFYNTGLTEVTIPGSVEEVYPSSFKYCWDLVSFKGPLATPDGSGLIVDGSLVSVLMAYLEEHPKYVIPDGVTSLADELFMSFDQLQEVTLPETLSEIGEGVFDFCQNLQLFHGKFASEDGHLLVKDGEIIASALNGVEELVIPEGVTSIKAKAFVSKPSLREVTLPTTLAGLEEETFYRSNNIVAFHGKYATTDGRFLIDGNGTLLAAALGGLTAVTVPENVKRIGNYVFSYGPVASVALPEGLTEIGDNAFEFCRDLTGITLPQGLSKVGAMAFWYCSNEAFTTFILPANVIEIGHQIVDECSNLISITLLPDTIPAITGSEEHNWAHPLGSNFNNATIYVPANLLSEYRTAKSWCNQSNYQALPE